MFAHMDIGFPSLLSIAILMWAIATAAWISFWRRHASPSGASSEE